MTDVDDDHKAAPPVTASLTTADDAAAAEQVLLTWLCTEIARDGGATLVTSLKDHYWKQYSNKRLNALLVQSPIGKPKLLKFLEFHSPETFQVDRSVIPHWVILTDPTPNNPHVRFETDDNVCGSATAAADEKEALRNKILYILRRRHSRLDRRTQQQIQNHEHCHMVNVHWIIRQCPWELHFYLRAINYYRRHVYHNDQRKVEVPQGDRLQDLTTKTIVHPVMSLEWQELALEPCLAFLLVDCADDLDGDRVLRKVWLKEKTAVDATTTSTEHEVTATIGSNGGVMTSYPNNESSSSSSWLDPLMEELIRLVQEDGATQVYLGLLLHRYASLKRLLGGRDLWLVYQEHKYRFTTKSGVLVVLQRPPNGNIYLQWKPTDALDAIKPKKPRMKVDTVGLFSVTSSKWASAIANIIIQCCQRQLQWNVSEMIAIDMTVSVGGMTLGLAKAKQTFSKILAMEIDATRAQLCQENMRNHGVSADHVQVIHTDSVQAIPTFPKRCCIVIDPPWGGEHYKEYKDQPPLLMGPWKLEDVLLKVAQSVPDCVVGLRLPVTLNVESFLDQQLAKERNLCFDRLSIRKLSAQVLVVLRLQGQNMSNCS